MAFDPSMLAAMLPPQGDPALAGMSAPAPAGAAPVPLPAGAGAPEGMPPELMALMGGGMGGPAPMDPMMGGGGEMANPYPTADPGFMTEALGQLVQMQQMDQGKLAADQQSALIANPMFEALMSGKPMGPGAGQDGQALGAPSMEMPMPGADPMAAPMGY